MFRDGHEGASLKYYCHDCNKTICKSCCTAEHKGYKLDGDLQKLSKKFSDELKSTFPELNKYTKENKGELQSMEKAKRSLLYEINASDQYEKELKN